MIKKQQPADKLIQDKLESISSKIDDSIIKITQKIEEQTKKTFQMMDLTSVQTSLLAILFSLLIFSITDLVFYIDHNIFLTLFSLFVLLMGIPITYYVTASIFIGNLKNKLFNFEMALVYITMSGILILLTALSVGINSIFPSYHVNNLIAVIIIISTFVIFLVTFPIVQKRFQIRFNKLYVKEVKTEDIRKKFYKYIVKKSAWYGTLCSLLIVVFTGLWKNTPKDVSDKQIYGAPLPWLIQQPNKIPSIEILYNDLLLNWLILGLIVFSILLVYQYLNRKKMFSNYLKKNVEIKKGTWDEESCFVKYE